MRIPWLAHVLYGTNASALMCEALQRGGTKRIVFTEKTFCVNQPVPDSLIIPSDSC